jgi:hypothetical protein
VGGIKKMKGRRVEGKKIEGFDTPFVYKFKCIIYHSTLYCIFCPMGSFKEAFRRPEGPYRSPMPWGPWPAGGKKEIQWL